MAHVLSAPPHARPRQATTTRARRTLTPAVRLTLAAGLIATIYGLALVVPMPVWAGHPVGPPSFGDTPSAGAGWPGLLIAIGFGLVLCGPYRPYVLALRTVRDHVPSTRLVLALTLLLAAVGLLIYPRFGSDLFDYVGYARLWAVYHENPLVVPVSSHPSDWSYAFVWFRDRPPAYGPLWMLLTWPLVWLGGGENPLDPVVGYKLLSLGGYVACCALIWVSVEPGRRPRSLLLFAWSPLVLFEVLGKLHNDALPAVTALAAVSLAGHHRYASGLLAGVAGGLLKASALAVVPAIVLAHGRQRPWGSLVVGMAAAVGLTALLYVPFWAGPDTPRAVLQQMGRVVWSPGTLLMLGTGWLPGPVSEAVTRVALALAWAAGCLFVLRRTHGQTSPDLATASGSLLLLTLVLLTTAFYAHYLVPVVALAAVSGDRRLEQLALGLSIGGLAAYGVELVSLAGGSAWIGSQPYLALGSLLTLAPAAILLVRDRYRW